MRNMNDILRQAQVMQNKISQVQKEASTKSFEASVGGGAVKAIVNGVNELQKLIIDPETVKGGDVEMLQDLVIAAVNEANRIAKESMEREMQELSHGIRIPGLF